MYNLATHYLQAHRQFISAGRDDRDIRGSSSRMTLISNNLSPVMDGLVYPGTIRCLEYESTNTSRSPTKEKMKHKLK